MLLPIHGYQFSDLFAVSILTTGIDQSGTHDNAVHIITATYAFRTGVIASFNHDWEQLLLRHRDLPYLHMTEFMGRFGHLPIDERTGILVDFIKVLNQYMSFGAIYSMDRAAFDEYTLEKWHDDVTGDIETSGLIASCRFVANTSRQLDAGSGIHYIYETAIDKSGKPTKSQERIAKFFVRIQHDPALRETFMYQGHQGVPKGASGARATEAADLLGWLRQRWLNGKFGNDDVVAHNALAGELVGGVKVHALHRSGASIIKETLAMWELFGGYYKQGAAASD